MNTQNNRIVEYVAFETCNINGVIIFFKDEERTTYEDGTVRKEFKYSKREYRDNTSEQVNYKDEKSFRNAIKRIASDKNTTLIEHKYIKK